MHIVFGLILVIFFVGTLCVFGVHGWRRVRREQMLAGQAAMTGLKFSRQDPFELPLKYAGFSLMRCGHGQIASNVAFGRMDSFDVQAFDFSYETGHGFERATHRYGVMVLSVSTEESVIMWSRYKPELVPFMVPSETQSTGPWCYSGSSDVAESVHAADSSEKLENAAAAVELKPGVLMVSIPYRDDRKWNYSLWLPVAMKVAKRLLAMSEENISFQVS